MKAIVPLAGWIVLAASVFGGFSTFNSNWTLGRYCMPHTLVADDGRHYLSGTEIDPISLAMVQSGYEEEIALGMATFFVGAMTWVFWRSANPPHPKRVPERKQTKGDATD